MPADVLAGYSKHNLTSRERRPEEIAYAVALLAPDEADFIVGITIQVDSGLTAHFPKYSDELGSGAPTGRELRP